MLRFNTLLRWAVAPVAGGLVVVPAQAQRTVEPSVFEPVAAFASRDLRESSGVAVSRRHPGLLWTHNDSGGDPILYAVDLKGREIGRVLLIGARAVDWEDIALGPCPGSGETCLYVGDTGDNGGKRSHASIYILPEPAEVSGDRTAAAHRVRITYPDGPQDIEALAVTPTGDILLVTKGRHGRIRTYRLVRDQLQREDARAAPWLDLAIDPQVMVGRLVTGAAVSPDGSTLAVRTYTEMYFFHLTDQPASIEPLGSCWLGLKEPQGEAVDFLDDSTLVLTSEGARGRRGGISRLRCPAYTGAGDR